MCAELMVISGADSAHHHTGCKIPEQVDSNVNALLCVTVWPPLHRIHEGLRVWFSTLVVACFCWVMCFDITHILSNLRTNVTFKESDICGLQKGIILFPCNNVLFYSFLFSFPMSHILSPSLSLSCLQWVTAASETLPRTAVESTSKILSMTHPCKWFTIRFPTAHASGPVHHKTLPDGHRFPFLIFLCWMDGMSLNLWTCDGCHLSVWRVT